MQVIFNWALQNWEEFDAWCCVKGVDPLELPAYRFYNLVIYAIMEDKDVEQRSMLERQLKMAEQHQHPFQLRHAPITQKTEKTLINEPKAKVQRYIPPWYRDEDYNYEIVKNVRRSLPK